MEGMGPASTDVGRRTYNEKSWVWLFRAIDSEKNLAEVKRCRGKPRGASGCDNCTPVAAPLDIPSGFARSSTAFYGFVWFCKVLSGFVRFKESLYSDTFQMQG
jgi:hypothetical protein